MLARSGRFSGVRSLQGEIVHIVDAAEWACAWRSHATLARQAGPRWEEILREIRAETEAAGRKLAVRYTTRLWTAQKTGSGARRPRQGRDANDRSESAPSAKSR